MRPLLRLTAALLLVPGLLVASPELGYGDRISDLRERIGTAEAREGVLTTQIAAATSRLHRLESQLGVVEKRVARLERELARTRGRLVSLSGRLESETYRLGLVEADVALAQRRLERRLVQLYETEQPDLLSIVLQADGLGDLIEQLAFFDYIGRRDREIASQIAAARDELRAARRRTAATKRQVAAAARALAGRTTLQQVALDELVARRSALEAARAAKRELLSGIRQRRRADEEDLEAMLAESARIAEQVQEAQTAAAGQEAPSPASTGGFVWPVEGVVTSGFGLPWGRLHERIDIAAPAGTPIVAAAAGTVVFAGWAGGYGNLVVIDHGGGVATAYGHQSSLSVTGGAVSQGQVIGTVGSTGRSTGPHAHFEVRLDGAPVDPLDYL
jgi:murein DD-endopeptidase MepM/ murein hydrolase activator NlpD